jgi:hypothetical protein
MQNRCGTVQERQHGMEASCRNHLNVLCRGSNCTMDTCCTADANPAGCSCSSVAELCAGGTVSTPPGHMAALVPAAWHNCSD